MKIGYQGINGSYSESAAEKLAELAGMVDAEFVPLVNSANVAYELGEGNIDYGVVAVFNSIGGTVLETEEALCDIDYVKVTAVIMEIHQCLFKKKRSVRNEDINKVYSHIQALQQTRKTLRRLFPYAKLHEVADTALAAKNLATDEYDDYSAVICSANAGRAYNLELMYENVNDDNSNRTMFFLIKMNDKA